MSRPSIPKLSLAFKKTATADTAPLSAQPPEKGPLKIAALGPANGSLSAPMAAIAMPKLNLPARQQLANGASAAAPPPEQPPPDQHQPQGKGAQEGQHAVYLLVPGLAFPTHSAPGEPPLTVGGLKALCYDNLCPPLPPSSSSSSPSAVSSPPQLEFFRLCLMRNLDDGSNILPTKLCPTNYEVENINRVHINGIRSAPVKYPGKDDVPSEDGPRRILLNWLEKGCIALNHVELKIDAQVMLIKNLSSELVNGSRGVVVGWADQGPSALYFY
ncbi:uncharacterized protein ACA1_267700 [Acanthamoeba castellanii str. Neff]|uniref:DNA helicase Pif1-like 2B domain-containing protein n=1 Tax=Acanthamoeba castellanii (strain ATCC 30010 / Neff) TaxID=1257118 RepID=L8H2M6_ACACF|nr:uncharacterized protein ACA1_267700 [Acanthamoeba castellanii str. Neff]ELR19480.1 hypothetical protein ACA1_267700 [Acanthamoeba castellanii str. Neff]